MLKQKVEVRFEKGEALRFISHLDLMRAFQRALRRAALPVRLTEGFNPRPRVVFPAALEVGVASLDEVAELELTQWIPLQELKDRLAAQLPPALRLTSLRELPPTRHTQTPRLFRYRLHLAEAGLRLSPATVPTALTATSLPFLRQRTRPGEAPQATQVDLRPFLAGAAVEAGGDLALDISPGPAGQARPLEFLSLWTGLPLPQLKHIRITRLSTVLTPHPIPPPPNPLSAED